MSKRMVLLAALVPLLAPRDARATDLGVDMNQPISNGAMNLDAVPAIASEGASFARVNFLHDLWSGPTDATPQGPKGQTWFEAYDELVDAYAAQGVEVYALLTDALDTASGPESSDAWQTAFASDAAAVVDHFKDRVRFFEIYNEPNNWIAPNTPALQPQDFANLLTHVWAATKDAHPNDPCWQSVQILSGPILSLDVNNGADYFTETYDAGVASYGWSQDSAPFDGVAYHIYVAQGSSETTQSVSDAVTNDLDAFHDAISTARGGMDDMPIYVSEFGWNTASVSPAQQADFMQAGLEALDASTFVPIAIWFSLQDFGASDQWGLFSGPPYDASTAKTSATEFATLASMYRPKYAAHPTTGSSVGVTMQAGATETVHVEMQNDGLTKWSESSGFPVRLGAGPGCPESSVANQFDWSLFASGGYENSKTDARAYLATDVAPGDVGAFDFTITAPSQPGTYRFEARMVAEALDWFGFPIAIDVVVTDQGSASSGAGNGGAASATSSAATSATGVAESATSGDGASTTTAMSSTSSAGGASTSSGTSANGGATTGDDANGATSTNGGCSCESPSKGSTRMELSPLLFVTAAIGLRYRSRRSRKKD